jgi:hypothetical protein
MHPPGDLGRRDRGVVVLDGDGHAAFGALAGGCGTSREAVPVDRPEEAHGIDALVVARRRCIATQHHAAVVTHDECR